MKIAPSVETLSAGFPNKNHQIDSITGTPERLGLDILFTSSVMLPRKQKPTRLPRHFTIEKQQRMSLLFQKGNGSSILSASPIRMIGDHLQESIKNSSWPESSRLRSRRNTPQPPF